jgi:hypothetical protein
LALLVLLLLLLLLLLGLGRRALQQLPEGVLQIELAAAAVKTQLGWAHSSSRGRVWAGVLSMVHLAAYCSVLSLWRLGAQQAEAVRLGEQYSICAVCFAMFCGQEHMPCACKCVVVGFTTTALH